MAFLLAWIEMCRFAWAGNEIFLLCLGIILVDSRPTSYSTKLSYTHVGMGRNFLQPVPFPLLFLPSQTTHFKMQMKRGSFIWLFLPWTVPMLRQRKLLQQWTKEMLSLEPSSEVRTRKKFWATACSMQCVLTWPFQHSGPHYIVYLPTLKCIYMLLSTHCRVLIVSHWQYGSWMMIFISTSTAAHS